jgi:hypothetical protein
MRLPPQPEMTTGHDDDDNNSDCDTSPRPRRLNGIDIVMNGYF